MFIYINFSFDFFGFDNVYFLTYFQPRPQGL
jgi:hypothetical protein